VLREYGPDGIARLAARAGPLGAVLARLDYLFLIRAPDAPRLVLAGGMVAGGGAVSGIGPRPTEALVALCGEAAEQIALARADLLGQGSEGCGAGASAAAAFAQAALELIERDAVARWWNDGHPGRAVEVPEAELARFRGAATRRLTCLVEITGPSRIPAVAALSFAADGHGFAAGAVARLALPEAAEAALREMAQAEAGLHVIRAKLARFGRAALGPADLRAVERALRIDAGAFAAAAAGVPGRRAGLAGPLPVSARPDPAGVRAALARSGIRLESRSLGTLGPYHIVRATSRDLQPGRASAGQTAGLAGACGLSFW
jgi:YcaO cyclodehydratase, ATP-ad Mg2+-binding